MDQVTSLPCAEGQIFVAKDSEMLGWIGKTLDCKILQE